MWVVLEHRRLSGRLARIPSAVRKRYEVWKSIVQNSGPQGLREMQGMRDEPLRGLWKGYRSSRLNRKYRVIYRVRAVEVLVLVVDVSAHDYGRKPP